MIYEILMKLGLIVSGLGAVIIVIATIYMVLKI